MPERQRPTTRLKTLFERPELFVLAGGINPIGAKTAEALGYDAFYMSGGNTSAHQLGWPDSGTSMRDMVDNARKIVLTVQIPVFADADTGYGDAISTHFARACAHVREGHDGSAVCGVGVPPAWRAPPPWTADPVGSSFAMGIRACRRCPYVSR